MLFKQSPDLKTWVRPQTQTRLSCPSPASPETLHPGYAHPCPPETLRGRPWPQSAAPEWTSGSPLASSVSQFPTPIFLRLQHPPQDVQNGVRPPFWFLASPTLGSRITQRLPPVQGGWRRVRTPRQARSPRSQLGRGVGANSLGVRLLSEA